MHHFCTISAPFLHRFLVQLFQRHCLSTTCNEPPPPWCNSINHQRTNMTTETQTPPLPSTPAFRPGTQEPPSANRRNGKIASLPKSARDMINRLQRTPSSMVQFH